MIEIKKSSLRDPEWWTSIAVDLLDMNLGSTAKDLSKLLKNSESDISQSIIDLYVTVFNECIEGYKQVYPENSAVKIKINKKSLIANNLHKFDPLFPTHYELFYQIIRIIRELGLSREIRKTLEEWLRSEFSGYFEYFVAASHKRHEVVKKYIDELRNNYKTVDGQTFQHTNEILKTIWSDPLPIDNDLTLWSIYVTPSAKYWTPYNKEKNDISRARDIFNLIESLLSVLETSFAPIIIHGQPGHGKTSTARMLVHALKTKEDDKIVDRTTMLFYEFRTLGRLDGNEIKILNARTEFIRNEEFFYGRKTLIILDGLDERQITDGTNDALKGFIRNLFDLSDKLNKINNTKFNLIFTGRSQFVNKIQSAFNADYHLYSINDFSKEQVINWLNKYSAIKDIETPLTYNDFSNRRLEELIHQPILLTIASTMLSDKEGKKLVSEFTVRNISKGEIYRTIIKWTFRKKWHKGPSFSDFPNEKLYIRFLQVIAFILFSSGMESIKVSTLINRMKENQEVYQIDSINNESNERVKEILSRLAVSFFFKGIEDDAFSFIHKSIKDYLVVSAIFTFIKESLENFNSCRPVRSCMNLNNDFTFLIGQSALSFEDHVEFLEDIIRFKIEESKCMLLPLQEFFLYFCDRIFSRNKEMGNNSPPIWIQSNIIAALLYLINIIFNNLSENDRLDLFDNGKLNLFEKQKYFRNIVNILNMCDKSIFNGELIFKNILISNSDLSGLYLAGAKIIDSDISGTNLGHANLRNTDLSNSNFERAIIDNACLTGAKLEQVVLAHAKLIGTDMRNADLINANLNNAEFQDAIFTNATLYNADLRKSNLQGVDLRNAKLKNADLRDSNLDGASFDGADIENLNLCGVDLRYSNGLKIEQLSISKNDDNTKIPEYFEREYNLTSIGQLTQKAKD